MVKLTKLFTPVASLDADEARAYMNARPEGSYTLLDVRQPAEYDEAHLPGSTLIPLPDLGEAATQLDRAKPVVVYCAIGGRSRVAAQLLAGMDFAEVYNLKGGIKAWEGQKAAGPVELNLDLVRGDETPEEVVRLAYGLEMGLQRFYLTLKEQAADPGLQALCTQMAAIEARHEEMLFQMLTGLGAAPPDRQAFEAGINTDILEGGFQLTQFMEQNAPYLTTVPGTLEVAMMLETQALDLYLRFAQKESRAATKAALFTIAGEERGHLAALGRFWEEQKTGVSSEG